MREFEVKPPEMVNAICIRLLTKVCRLKLLKPESQPLHVFSVIQTYMGLRYGSVYTHIAQFNVDRNQLKALSHPAHL